MSRFSNPGWVWRNLCIDNPDLYWCSSQIQKRLERVLSSWDLTGYMSGQQCKGVKADCIGFVFGVIDEMYGRPSPKRDVLPHDTAMHSRDKAIACMKALRRLYAPNSPVEDGSLEPGDIVVTGHSTGGPGHVMIVGARKNTLWHCNEGVGVHQTGLGFAQGSECIFGVYRFDDRELWVR